MRKQLSENRTYSLHILFKYFKLSELCHRYNYSNNTQHAIFNIYLYKIMFLFLQI